MLSDDEQRETAKPFSRWDQLRWLYKRRGWPEHRIVERINKLKAEEQAQIEAKKKRERKPKLKRQRKQREKQ